MQTNPNLEWQENLFNYVLFNYSEDILKEGKHFVYNLEAKNLITKSLQICRMSDRNKNIILDYLSGYGSLKQVGIKYNISVERTRQILVKFARLTYFILDSSEQYFGSIAPDKITPFTETRNLHSYLPVRVFNCLMRGGLFTINDILNKDIPSLYKIRNFGKESFNELFIFMNKIGYTTRDMITWEKI